MHGIGRAVEERKRSPHMWTVPTRTIVAATADGSSSSSVNSFCKDGRRISVGDCALFKPPQDSPPFIGIIRWLAAGKEDKLKLGVNWLYRPAEVKLGKGVLLEAAPNEIFYSFHKDEIPAASLLHPCKVAFLPKGVELPSGISSFVCRQVYDITNKCLWWLTDQDYIDERQEEVDQLLYKTQIEMHATLQSDIRSPKPMSGPTSTSQLKAGSDSVQNSASSVPTQVKGKKRERGDQSSEAVKRERTAKADDGDSNRSRLESNLKSETAKITEKGGLIDSEGVERLVQVMQPDRTEKIDLAGRSMLVGVLAATDKFDCLSRFVQLKGLPVLDEWLQEVHKGRIGDGSGSKDGDKSIEEFLLVLLRALDKLPVNLQALQMCNIGKSVNHLRTHKNLEIQKKARSLVDTWKKRVEAEMNINDAKSGSNQAVPWPAKARLPEVSHGGNRQTGASADVAMKSSVPQLSASKIAPAKVVLGESTSRCASASLGSMKSVPSPAQASTNFRDSQPQHAVGVASDLPLTTVRDEKSSSSSQSHNSQSCSSDHTKTGLSVKEDARSPTAGSMSGNKISGGSSRHRKSINGLPGSTLSGVLRESGSSRSPLNKNPASERQSQSGFSCEKALDGPIMEGNSHKLIVKIPNRVRSPAQSASGALFEDPSMVNSRASSPVLSERHDQFDRSLKEKSDGYRANNTSDVNTESWQSNDFKDVLTGSDEGDGSPAAITDEKCRKTDDESKKLAEAKGASLSSGNELKVWNSHEASLRSINALIESCVKYSEANVSMSIGDDVGMNLLASVAAGEMSKTDLVSPTDSPQRNTPAVEPSCTGSDLKVKSSPVNDLTPSHTIDGAGVEDEEQVVISSNVGLKDGGNEPASLMSGEKPVAGDSGHFNSSSMELQLTADRFLESDGKSTETTVAATVASSLASAMEKTMDIEGGKPLHNKKAINGVNANAIVDAKEKESGSLLDKDKVSDVVASPEVQMEAIEGSSSYPSLEIDGKNKKLMSEGLNSGVKTEEKPLALIIHSEAVKGIDEVLHSSGGGKDLVPEKGIELKTEKNEKRDATIHMKTETESNEPEGNAPSSPENRMLVGLGSADTNHDDKYLEKNLACKEVHKKRGRPASHKVSPAFPMQETDQHERSRGSKLTGAEADDAEEFASTTADASCLSVAGVSDMEAKVEFDLNEGFTVDDGKLGETNNFTEVGCSAAICLVNPLPFPVSSVSTGIPASITVTAAAKGPFVPPVDLLKSKGELGWKGSAATSAFRPAEPRKAPEMPQETVTISLLDATAGKNGRFPLDIDLNVPDERILEDLASQDSANELCNLSSLTNNHEMAREELMGSAPARCSEALDLDLNRVDDASDMGNYPTSSGRRMDVPPVPVKSKSGGPFNDAVSACRDFDLNNGPAVDEMNAEPSPFVQLARSSLPAQLSVSGLRMSNAEMGNFSPWFHSGSNYSAVAIPSIMPDRGEQPFPVIATGGLQRWLGPTGSSNLFSPDIYRGPVLSSSPAVPFPSSPFQYPVFPFGTSFPLPSATFSGGSTTYADSSSGGKVCFPAVHPQFLGPAGAVSSHYPRPYVSFPDGSNNSSGESSRKWGRHALDLNAGPGSLDIEGRDEASLPPRQRSVASSQAIADEQARIYPMAGGVLKRKEPEGGWDGYKQSPWQ